MAQGYNQEHPILALRDKLIDTAKKAKEWGEKGTKKPDTSWHDEMVRKANESFRKEEEKKVVKKPAQSLGMKKKSTTSKAYPKKRVAGKL